MHIPQSLIDMDCKIEKLKAVSHMPPPTILRTAVSDKATRWSAGFSVRRHERHEAVTAQPDLYQPMKTPSMPWYMALISTAWGLNALAERGHRKPR